MHQYKKFICCALFVCLTGCCLPIPWKAWRYEHTYKFSGYPSAFNMPDERKFNSTYVDGALVNIRVMAHNETTNSGGPPYQLIIPILSNNKEHTGVTFHSISMLSTLGSNHVVSPINVNAAAKKIENLQFPVTKDFEPYSKSWTNPSPRQKQFVETSLWSDKNLKLQPKKNEVIKILIDIEVHKAESSVRKVVEYEFHPRKESGDKRCFFPT